MNLKQPTMFIPLLISLIALASGQVIVDGQCNPNVPVQSNFKLADVSILLNLYNKSSMYVHIIERKCILVPRALV